MNIEDFSDNLCHLNTAIARYLNAKKAIEYISRGHLPLPNDVLDTIEDVLHEKKCQCENKIIELATNLAPQSKEKPSKKKK